MDYLRYYIASIMMLAGISGFALGGRWVWLGAATFPIVTALDLLFSRPDLAVRRIRRPRLAEAPLYLHAVLVVALVSAAAWRVHVGQGGAPLPWSGVAGIVVSLAWLAVVPNIPVAHELIHRHRRLDRFLGFVLTFLVGDPLRRLAHLRGHHTHFGLPDDPDTARRGESIYAFMWRAAIESGRDAYLSEKQRLARKGLGVWSWRGDVIRSACLMIAVLAAIGLSAGLRALLVLAAAFVIARFVLESFNYLQHYGLVRVAGAPHARRHTWSHFSPVVRAAAFEITNHAHHHMSPTVPFHALIPDPTAPQMPSALLCVLTAFVPPVWERFIARPRLRDWDHRFATAEERRLAAAANAAAGWPDWLSDAPPASVPVPE